MKTLLTQNLHRKRNIPTQVGNKRGAEEVLKEKRTREVLRT